MVCLVLDFLEFLVAEPWSCQNRGKCLLEVGSWRGLAYIYVYIYIDMHATPAMNPTSGPSIL